MPQIKTVWQSFQYLPSCVKDQHFHWACGRLGYSPAVSQMGTIGQYDVRISGRATDRVLLGVLSPASVQLYQGSRLVRFPVRFCPAVSHIVTEELMLAVVLVSA